MSCTGEIFINGIDAGVVYGFSPAEETIDSILAMRKRKEPYSNDWPEINGKEYDLSDTPKYEDRIINLKGNIYAVSETDFHTKYNALKAAFNVTGTVVLSCNELGSAYNVNVFYLDSPQPKRLTGIKNANPVVVEIELKLQEVQTPTP